jgi:acyl-coenzyme A thioesterase PaaI-like protein
MTDDADAATRRRDRRLALARAFVDNVPHNHALGLVVEGLADRTARFRLPYAAKLVGNPETAEATCHHMSKHVAFVRAVAEHADGGAPIATAAGTFMIATKLGTVAPRGGGA